MCNSGAICRENTFKPDNIKATCNYHLTGFYEMHDFLCVGFTPLLPSFWRSQQVPWYPYIVFFYICIVQASIECGSIARCYCGNR